MSVLGMFRMDGQVAFVNGAGRGIGAASAIALAEAGADVAIRARTVAQLEETAASITSLGRRALVLPATEEPGDDVAALERAQRDVATVAAEDPVVQYIVDVCRATRRSPSLSLGVSPRGAIALLRTSRAWAYLSGRDFITPDDVKIMAPSTLSHRVRLTTEAELEGSQVEAVLAATLASVPVPR